MRIIPLEVSFDDAQLICSQLGEEIPFAKNDEEFKSMFEGLNQNQLVENCSEIIWTPLRRSLVNSTKWEFLHQTTDFFPWANGEPQREYLDSNCAAAFQFEDEHFLRSCGCDLKFCPICKFSRESMFRLRGLCPTQKLIDTDYFFLGNDFNGIIFQGISGKTYISSNESSSSWDLNSFKDIEGIGKQIGSANNVKLFPLGFQKWNLKMNCEKFTQSSSDFDLNMNKVHKTD